MRGLRSMAAAGLLLGAGALGAATWSPGHPGASAQETTQTQSQRLAAIHAGSCEDPAEQATFPLAVVQPQQTEAGAQEQASDVRGLRTTGPVSVGNGSVATTLDALLDGEQSYVMLIHRNANETSPGVACGEIGGLVIEGQLTLGLRPINKSGVAGIAVLGGQGEELVGAVVLFDDVDAFSKTNNNRNNAGAGGNQADRAARQGGGGGGQRASGGGGGGGGGGLSAEERAARKAQRKAERQAARAAQGGGGGGPQGGGVAAPPAGGEVVGGVGTQPALEEPQGTVPADETPAVEEPTQPPVDETPAGETPIDETPVVETPVGETPEPGAETPPAETPPAETPAGETPPAETPPADAEAPPTEAPADEVPIDETGGDVPPADVGDQEQQAAPEETPAVEAFGDVEGSVIGPTTIEQAAPVGAVDHWQAGAPLGQWRPVDTAESALAPEPAAEEVFAEQ